MCNRGASAYKQRYHLAAISILGKAFITVHWSIAPGLKGYLAILAALGTDYGMHNARFANTTLPLLQATLFTASGFTLQPSRQVKLLFTCSERELSAAITTYQILILESHTDPPPLLVWIPLADTASRPCLPAC